MTYPHTKNEYAAAWSEAQKRIERMQALLREVLPCIDEWNFPITLADRIKEEVER